MIRVRPLICSLLLALAVAAPAAAQDLTLTGVDDQLKRQDVGAWPNAFRKARFLSAVDCSLSLQRLAKQIGSSSLSSNAGLF